MAAAKEEALDALAGVVRASGLVDPGCAAVVMTSGGPDSACAAATGTGHPRTDLAETVVYRLAASPGARALRGMPERRGRLVRPLRGFSRADARALAIAAGLPFEDDVSNLDPAFARNRIRAEVMPVLAELGAAETNIAETHAELVEEAELLDRLVLAELEAAGSPAGSARVAAAALERFEP